MVTFVPGFVSPDVAAWEAGGRNGPEPSATMEDVIRHIEHIRDVGEFESKPGTGIAVQLDVEDAVGVMHQAEKLVGVVEEEL